MTTVPTKIVLKSTTRMSLNDRFSNIAPTVQNIRANVAAEHQVSAANRRLAQQLANRPGVQTTAPGLYQQPPPGVRQGGNFQGNKMRGKRNLQQRLGQPNIKNRLTLPAGDQNRGRGRGRGRGGNIIQTQGPGGDNQWNVNRRGRGGFSPRGVRGRGVFRGRGGIRGRGRGTFNRFNEESYRGLNSGRRRGSRRGAGPQPDRLTGQSTVIRRGGGGGGAPGGGRGMSRGARRGGPRGGRGGRGRGNNNNSGAPVTQHDLDSQLDTYMAKTKSVLDTELDAYMLEASS
ncbi:chromatin target of PRMT1 protein isoform X1 [Aplysia californica]|uniref:Chromatin target of PRMT1 protein isoform X1 n=1 Tax=Aplysia californica TaxID=6500 RepID=A0ABM1AEF1_APLCA|nr:chromatin target of PRMT1 protein isoform X1 [Aplysia californica]